MSKICKSCGTVLADDVLFCTECGAPCPPETEAPKEFTAEAQKVEETPFVAPVYEEAPKAPVYEEAPKAPVYEEAPKAPVYEEAPKAPYVAPIPAPAPAPAKAAPSPAEAPLDRKNQPVSTAAFFWLGVVFAMPFTGFVISIILTCAAKKINLKHFAKAAMIAKIIGIAVSIAAIVGLYFILVALRAELGGYGIEVNSFQDLIELIKMYLE